MSNYDIAIIGAATSGAFFARRMAEKGYKVKIIEKNSFEKIGSKYDIFHVAKKEFDRFGIPKPQQGDKEWAFEFTVNYTSSPTGKYPKKTEDPIVGMHMHDYTVKMNQWAQEAGAEIEYEASFVDFIYENDKIAGFTYTTSEGDKELHAKVVVDCSGMDSVARRKLPKDSTVENFEITPEDMFYVVLRYVKFADPNLVWDYSTGWPFYKSWLAPQQDPNGGILGIGACHSYEYAEEILKGVIENIELPEYTITHIEKGKTPYTRPPYSFVTDNFIVSGDAACLTKPNNGEGVTSSMVQIESAVKVLDEALKAGDTSKEKLWEINVLYNKEQGADFASTRAMLTKAVKATKGEFEYFFKHDIIFSEKFLDNAADGPGIDITLGDIAKIGGGIIAGIVTGKVKFSTIKHVATGVLLGDKLKKHYLKFPASPVGYKDWTKTADEIWAKVGKMQ